MNEDGIGYNWIILVIGFVAVFALFNLMNPVYNQMFDTSDDMISHNMMSQQTKNGLTFQRNLITWLPVIAIIGALIAAIYIANAEKQRRGY